LPAPACYNIFSIAADPTNEAKIALELAESWHRYTIDERRVEAIKSAWLNRAVAFMACGLLAFGVVAIDVLLASSLLPARNGVVH
jgi:hypothetical protein